MGVQLLIQGGNLAPAPASRQGSTPTLHLLGLSDESATWLQPYHLDWHFGFGYELSMAFGIQ